MDKRRIEINARISEIHKLADALYREKAELKYESLLINDETQRYAEAEETFGRGKKKTTALIGRIYWDEYFIDEDRPEHKIKIERSQIVRQDGEWIVYNQKIITMTPTEEQIAQWKHKATKWDALDEKIGKFYDEEVEKGDEDNEFALADIGEIAAMAFGYL